MEKPSDPPKKKPTITTTTDRYSSSLPFLCVCIQSFLGITLLFFSFFVWQEEIKFNRAKGKESKN